MLHFLRIVNEVFILYLSQKIVCFILYVSKLCVLCLLRTENKNSFILYAS
jgi:hypothetical protein